MSRRSLLVALGCSCAAVVAAAPTLAQQDFDKVQVTTTKVTDGVYMLTGAGGNIGVAVGPEALFLIDDEWAPMTPKVKAAVAALSDKPVRFVLNTHWHPDHSGGNKDLGEAGSLIVAHDNVRVRMSSEQFIAALNMRFPASAAKALPVVTFDSGVTLHLNGDDVQAIHVPPAHTDGDAIVRFQKANVLHGGDVFFNGMYPFVDLSSGGSFLGMITGADKLLSLADANTKIIPGHGPLADRAALVAYRDMLVSVRDKIEPLVRQGKTQAEVVAAKPTRELDAKWGKGFMPPDTFVGIVYTSLSQGGPRR